MARPKNVPTLPPPGYFRQEELKRRLEQLERVAEKLTSQGNIYKVDPSKLKEEPEILKHFDFVSQTFTVTNPRPGYAYFWERNHPTAIALRQQQGRYFLGNAHLPTWEVVTSCGCAGDKHGSDCSAPEAQELKQADGTRRIGDVILMRIPLEAYELIHKRMGVMQKIADERNAREALSELVQSREGAVKLHLMHEDPRRYFEKHSAKVDDEPIAEVPPSEP